MSKIVNQNSRKRSQDPSFKPPVTPWNLFVLKMEDEGGYQRSNLLGADGGNYYPWSKRMEARLIDKNCWNAIDPGFGDAVHENPDEAAAIAGLNQEQQRVNRKARGLIFDALHSTTLYDVGEFQLAKRAWDTLREMFGEFGIIHAMMFYKELTRLEKTPEMSMTDYISKMHELVQKVRMGGIPVSDISFAVLMLLGLPLKQYDSFIRSFEGDINALTSKSVKGKLMMEERRATLNAKAEETIALKVTGGKKNPRGKGPKQQPQAGPSQPQGEGQNQDKPCYNCKQTGHTSRKCPVWLAFKKQQAEANNSASGKATVVKKDSDSGVLLCATAEVNASISHPVGAEAFLLNAETVSVACLTQGDRNTWYVDSGASDHMVSDVKYFDSIDYSRKGQVKVGDGFKLCVEGMGIAKVRCERQLILTEAMYVPSLYCNLLSVPQLTVKNVKVVFDKSGASGILGEAKLFTARKAGKMYVLNIDKNQDHEAKAVALPTASIQSWHKRMGHVHHEAIHKIPALSRVKREVTEKCDVCAEGKMSRKSFPNSQSRASRPLELAHTDVMGKFNPPSNGGACYAIVFTDDYSRYTTVMTMKTKDEAFVKIKQYKGLMEGLTGDKLTKIRSDFGKEYVNEEVDEFLKNLGVTHQKSSPHCQQQNGRSERQNRTLFEMARSMMSEAGAEKKWWAEALSTAAYIRNRTPCSAINFEIPTEVLYKKKLELSDYEKLHPFGCRVQAMREIRGKLDPKTVECVMLGYEENTKDGYRLLNLETGKLIIRRDAVFHEDSFPWRENTKEKKIHYPDVMDDSEESEEETEAEIPSDNDDQQHEDGEQVVFQIPDLPDDEVQVEIPEVIPPVLRRSARRPKPKKVCDCDEGGHSCSVCETFVTACAFKCEEAEPESAKEALSCPSSDKWKKAMEEELARLKELNTWDIVPRPQGKKVIGSTWKFKIKTDSSGNPIKYKARLVAQGFAQRYGLDYYETYSPVVKRKSIRLMLALGIEKGWNCEHVDVISAYINSEIKEEIYLEQPEGFVVGSKKSQVCKLNKCLYGLKQSGMEWYHKIQSILIKMGFKPSLADPCLFIHKEKVLYVCLYVDDIASWGKLPEINWFKKSLSQEVEIRELGEISDFLPLRIQRTDQDSISIDQHAYIDQILEEFKLSTSKGLTCPLSAAVFESNNESDGNCDNLEYRRALGMLLYVANGTRPDLSFCVSFLCQFASDPKNKHMAGVRHLMRYLKHTKDYCIVYKKTGGKLDIFSDADYANNKLDRKSFSGLLVMMAGGPIEWRCKKQTVVALSTQHAEYIAMAVAAQEALWLKNIFNDLGVAKMFQRPCIQADNTSALALAQKDIVDDRSKAVDIKYHFIKDVVKKKLIELKYVMSRDNLADILTKSLNGRKTQELAARMGLTIA